MLVAWQAGSSESRAPLGQGGRGGFWSRDCRIELLDYHRSLVGKQMLVRGAARYGANVAAKSGQSSPAQSLHFHSASREEPPTVIKGSNSNGGPWAVLRRRRQTSGEPRWRQVAGARAAQETLSTSNKKNHAQSRPCEARRGRFQSRTVSGLGLISQHQTLQLAPCQRDWQLANGATRHERRHGA